MLVDLARNDVGRVAHFGTVHVDELMTLERYSHVMHLTSQVSGALRDGLGPIDVLRATLPAGTVSGAPKVRAMEIIDELEPVKRGPYAGVVGYLDWRGNLDTAIAIRTMFVADGGASVQAGAGIVADSDPDDEDLECHNKAAALLAAIPAARRMTRPRQRRLTGAAAIVATVSVQSPVWSTEVLDVENPGQPARVGAGCRRRGQKIQISDEDEAEERAEPVRTRPMTTKLGKLGEARASPWRGVARRRRDRPCGAAVDVLAALHDDRGAVSVAGVGRLLVDGDRVDDDAAGFVVAPEQEAQLADQLLGVAGDRAQPEARQQRRADGEQDERHTEHRPDDAGAAAERGDSDEVGAADHEQGQQGDAGGERCCRGGRGGRTASTARRTRRSRSKLGHGVVQSAQPLRQTGTVMADSVMS